MKKFLSFMLVLALLASFAPSLERTEAKAAGGSLVSHIPEQHPRLLVDDFDSVREKINTNPQVADWYSTVKAYCDNLLPEPTHAYDLARLQAVADGAGGGRRIIASPEVLMKLMAFAFVTMIEDDNTYLDRLWQEIEVMINLPTWNDAHWLEPAELLQGMAVAYDWCYYKWTDEQLELMHEAMVKFALEPSLREYDDNPRWYQWHWGFEGDEIGTNWTAVCNTGVIMGSVALADVEPALAEELLGYAIKSIKACANEFVPDAGYQEGIMYWKYATTNLILGAACIESAFDDLDALPELEEPFKYDILQYEGIEHIGNFATYLNGPAGAFNCGDAVPDPVTSAGLMYVAKRLGKPEYVQHHFNYMSPYDSMDQIIETIIWYDPEMEIVADRVPLENNFSTGASSMRNTWSFGDHTVFVAMQAGSNHRPHAHLEVGTFALDALGTRWVTMRGAGNYDWPNYGNKVDYYVGRPEGQNTIVINPDETLGQNNPCETQLIEQKGGKNEAYTIYDLTGAYEDYALSVKRGIKLFDNRGRVLVQDEIEFSEPQNEVWWFAHTQAEISISENGKEAILTQDGKRMFVRVLSPYDAELRIQEAAPMLNSPNPAIQPGSYGTKLAICYQTEDADATLAVEFTPLAGNMAPPDISDSHKVIPLEDWTTDADGARLEDVSMGVVAMLQGSSLAYAGSAKKDIDPQNPQVKPILQNDRTMVPLRFIAENIGGEISWNDETREATVIYNHQEIVTRVGESSITVAGSQKPLDSPSFISEGRVYVPLRAISEAMDRYVYDENGLVLISDHENPYENHPEYIEELRNLLKYNVIINGESCKNFAPTTTDYKLFATQNDTVAADIAGEGIIEAQSGETVSLDLGGQSYSFTFVPNEFEITEPYLTSISISCVEAEEYVPEGSENATHIRIKSAIASLDDGNLAANAVDNYIETRWSAQGEQYMQFDFGEEREVSYMYAAFFAGAARSEIFDILTSVDGENWTTVYSGQADGTTTEMQPFELEPSKARYVRYQGHGNTASTWNSVTEIRFYETKEDAEEDAVDFDELLEPSSFVYYAGDTYQMKLTGYMSNGDVVELNCADATWETSDGNLAYVDADGKLEVYETGTVAVYAYVNKGKIYRSNKFTIVTE